MDDKATSVETPLVRLSEVSKQYGDKLAVDRLTLDIAPGELFAFLGPNGAGKTTTIKMVTGLLRPTSGQVLVAGWDMTVNSQEARRNISYVPDQPYLYNKLTGRDFLAFIRDIYGLSGPEVHDYEERLIQTFEMSDFVDRLTETYSHGMRQRLAFAAAFLHRPKLLVLDEPMVGLDPKSMRIVKDMLRETTRDGTTVFMSTHTLGVAEELADRIGIIHAGKLAFLGTLQELRESVKEGSSLEDYFLKVTGGTNQ